MQEKRARLLAFYLPQYHPIKENDEWWGKGFTEWVTVAQARPLFEGHDQPKIPEELGFYDLRLEETRIAQAELAREHGVEAFCYWHYWLGSGKRLLERPFDEVLNSGKPDFPFCLAWANHSWKGVFFGANKRCLVEQTYPGKEDYLAHFNYVLKAFKDPRYVRVHNKPIFYIYRPLDIPNCLEFTNYWRELAKENGLEGIHFVGEGINLKDKEKYGLDAVTYSNHRRIELGSYNRFLIHSKRLLMKFSNKLKMYEYKDALKLFFKDGKIKENEYPMIIPGWDTTARLGKDATILHNSTPELFKEHVKEGMEKSTHIKYEENIFFVKSWNEWAEGNYLEPDRKYGRQYLEALKSEIFKNKE